MYLLTDIQIYADSTMSFLTTRGTAFRWSLASRQVLCNALISTESLKLTRCTLEFSIEFGLRFGTRECISSQPDSTAQTTAASAQLPQHLLTVRKERNPTRTRSHFKFATRRDAFSAKSSRRLLCNGQNYSETLRAKRSACHILRCMRTRKIWKCKALHEEITDFMRC